jgi:hypothetical protein
LPPQGKNELKLENQLKASAGMAPVCAGTICNAPDAGDFAPEGQGAIDALG